MTLPDLLQPLSRPGVVRLRALLVTIVLIASSCAGSTVLEGSPVQAQSELADSQAAAHQPDDETNDTAAIGVRPIGIELLLASTLGPDDTPAGYHFEGSWTLTLRCIDEDLSRRNWGGGNVQYLAQPDAGVRQMHIWIPNARSLQDAIDAVDGCEHAWFAPDSEVVMATESRQILRTIDGPVARDQFTAIDFSDQILTIALVRNQSERDAQADAVAVLEAALERLREQRGGGFIQAPVVDLALIHEVQAALEPSSRWITHTGVQASSPSDNCADAYLQYLNRGEVYSTFGPVAGPDRLTGEQVLLPGFTRADVVDVLLSDDRNSVDEMFLPGYSIDDLHTDAEVMATQQQLVLPGRIAELTEAIELYERLCIEQTSGNFERLEETTVGKVSVIRYLDKSEDSESVVAFRLDEGVLTVSTSIVDDAPSGVSRISLLQLIDLTHSGADALLTKRAVPPRVGESLVIASTLDAWGACVSATADDSDPLACDLESWHCDIRVGSERCLDIAQRIRDAEE